jgi:hypothetical protein
MDPEWESYQFFPVRLQTTSGESRDTERRNASSTLIGVTVVGLASAILASVLFGVLFGEPLIAFLVGALLVLPILLGYPLFVYLGKRRDDSSSGVS